MEPESSLPYSQAPAIPILNQLHPVPTTPSHFLKIHLNIILPSTSWSPQWPLSLRTVLYVFVYAFIEGMSTVIINKLE